MATLKARALREVEVLARMHTRIAIETLVGIAGDDGAPAAARVSAASALLDRGWGRPQQTITVDSGPEHMTDEELERHVEQRLADIAAAHSRRNAGSEAAGAAPGAETAAGSVKSSRLVH